MRISNLYIVLFIAICSTVSAQTISLKINSDIVLPKDSLESEALLASVNSFLSSVQNDSPNDWIFPAENIETQLLIDEIQDMQKNETFEDDSFFTPYLMNVTPLENNTYAIQLAYIAVHENSPLLRANFELIAHKTNESFLISSPLKRKTQNWKTHKIQNQIFHYPHDLNLEKIQRFYELTSSFDEKLKNNDGETHYYLCDTETAPLKLFGVEYKSDYNGKKLVGRWGASIDKTSIYVMTDSKFYTYPEHDLWHFRLGQVISRREVHRRVDCHIACLYGGCWGVSWDALFPIFCEKFVVGQHVDWLEHKSKSSNFALDGRKNYTDDFIGALLVKKIEKEKGFDGVWELLMTKRTKEEIEYFSVLESLIGISKENYNVEVFKLIQEEMNRLGVKSLDN